MTTQRDPNQVVIFDTTLRDGEQCPGATMNLHEKLEVARQLARLRVDVIEAGFPIASPGDYEAVRAIAEAVQGPTIAALARIKEVDIVNAGVDIVMLTSLNEGTPVSLIEAQAANRPVITTRVGGIENVVLQDRTAFLSASGDVNGLEQHLIRLIENDALRRSIGQGGWEHVRDRFHFTRLVQDTDTLYRSLLN